MVTSEPPVSEPRTGERSSLEHVSRDIGSGQLAFPAVAASVPLARSAAVAVAARHGVTGERLDAVRLAVSEAVTNAVVHAYGEEPGEIRLTLAFGRDELVVHVEDDGCGPDIPPIAPGLGLGCRVMDQVCDAFRLERGVSGGTSALLRFGCGSRPAAA